MTLKYVGLDVHQATFSVVVLDSVGIIGKWHAAKLLRYFPPVFINLQPAIWKLSPTSYRANSSRLSSPRPAARRVRAHFPSPCALGRAGGLFRCAGLQTAIRRAPARSSFLETFDP